MKNLRSAMKDSNADLVQIYLESAWDIVTAVYAELDSIQALADAYNSGDLDDFLTTADIDTLAEVNAIFTDFQVGRFSTQGEAEGGTNNDTTMTPLRVAQAIAALADPYDDNFTATSPPTATDDNTQGYGINSFWVDNTPDPPESYRCVDATTDAAVWVKTSLTSDELATVALTGDSDDLIEGAVNLLLTVTERARIAAAPTTGAEVAAMLFAEPDTNNFTDAEQTKLGNIEPEAKDDQTDAEIVTAYNNLVAQVSPAEKTAGTQTAIRRFSPLDVADMADTHSAGLSPALADTSFTALAGKKYFVDSTQGAITVTLPAGTPLANIGFADAVQYAGTNAITITATGGDTIDGVASFIIDQDEGEIEIAYDAANTNWQVVATISPTLVNVSNFVYKYRGRLNITGATNLTKADEGYLIVCNSASDFDLTIDGSEGFEENTFFNVINRGAGTVNVASLVDSIGSTDNECETGKAISIIKIAGAEWWVVGGTTVV